MEYNLFSSNAKKIDIKLPHLVKTEYLIPNPWNPNKVAKSELELLRISILKSGFCFPLIVIKKSEQEYMIIDGFHRHLVAKELEMDYIPVVVLDEPITELMACTIRFNRARGTHQIDQMSNIVKSLVDEGETDSEILKNLGMDTDEVLRLKQNSGIAGLFEDIDYSKSWDIN